MQVLVLDQSYQPLTTVPWQRAITLLVTNKVEPLEVDDSREIRSTSVSIKLPLVIRFLTAVSRRKKFLRFSKEILFMRDKGECQYCSKKLNKKEATYDHVRPKVQGGKLEWSNCVISCYACNQQKGGRTPEEAGMKLAAKPVQPNAHTLWSLFLSSQDDLPDSWKNWLNF